MIFPRLVIAGTHSGVGKTTATLAILAALRQRGRGVQAFKAGPDCIDPSHHTAVTGRPSRNLDGWMLSEAVNCDIFMRAAAGANLSIIEGMMGLFDGSSPVNKSHVRPAMQHVVITGRGAPAELIDEADQASVPRRNQGAAGS
jgi:cobyrinic acid a,c-diamide synthase